MTETKPSLNEEDLKAWYKPLLDAQVQDMIKSKWVTGTAVEARAVWILPYKILVAKVWDATQKSKFFWIITGESVATDHIPGHLATTAKDVARHFALKWQMDADKLLELASKRGFPGSTKESMEAYTKTLIQYAENLYDLTTLDEFWW